MHSVDLQSQRHHPTLPTECPLHLLELSLNTLQCALCLYKESYSKLWRFWFLNATFHLTNERTGNVCLGNEIRKILLTKVKLTVNRTLGQWDTKLVSSEHKSAVQYSASRALESQLAWYWWTWHKFNSTTHLLRRIEVPFLGLWACFIMFQTICQQIVWIRQIWKGQFLQELLKIRIINYSEF